jgi:CRISPR-associated protein Cpf1
MPQMRNSFGEDDYIISPVESEMPFITNESNPKGIRDADANGAYCIALKGLYWLNKDFPLNDKGNLTTISHEEWFGFLQERNKKQ